MALQPLWVGGKRYTFRPVSNPPPCINKLDMNKWFKFWGGEYLSDPKILSLDANERSCWVTLLCMAGQDKGVVKYLTVDMLITLSGIRPENIEKYKGVLDKFKKLNLVTLSNGNVIIKNWSKRQMSESYDRVKRFREKRSVTDNVTQTRLDKIRLDKIKKENPLKTF